MNTALTTALFYSALLLVSLALFALGMVTHAAWQRRQQRLWPLKVADLAERADINGVELITIARQLREDAAREQRGLRKHQLRRWAARLESIAVEHLECINALSLESLAAVGDRVKVHLGDFKPERRRNPQGGPVPASILRRREARHHG